MSTFGVFARGMSTRLNVLLMLARRFSDRHATAYMGSGILIASACALFAASHLSLERATAHMVKETVRLQVEAEQLKVQQAKATAPRRPVAELVATNADMNALPELLQNNAAATSSLWLEAHYDMNGSTIAGITKHPVAARLRGRYVDIVGFIAKTLASASYLALDSINVTTIEGPGNQVECELHFTAISSAS